MSSTIAEGCRILTHRECDSRWDDYVRSHPKGSIFHTRAMFSVHECTPNYEPFAIAAEDGEGKLIALLSAVRISTVPGLASTFASRSIWLAEPLCDPTTDGQLALASLIHRHEEAMKARTLFAEIRPLMASNTEREVLESAGYEYKDYLNFVVHVDRNQETLWKHLSKSCRKKINRSINRGVEIEIDNSHHGIETMYRLVRESYKRSKVPVADGKLFHSALDVLPAGVVQVRIARLNGKPVAGGIGLVFGNRFLAWYGGSMRISGLNPFDYLTWDEIRWSSDQGLKYYDFGGAGWPDEEYGPRDFKAKFGGDLVCYGRYRRIYAKYTLGVVSSTYELVRQILPIYRM